MHQIAGGFAHVTRTVRNSHVCLCGLRKEKEMSSRMSSHFVEWSVDHNVHHDKMCNLAET
jgi:hypothetical protein